MVALIMARALLEPEPGRRMQEPVSPRQLIMLVSGGIFFVAGCFFTDSGMFAGNTIVSFYSVSKLLPPFSCTCS